MTQGAFHGASRHLLGELLPAAVQEVAHDIHGHGEDNGRVVLRRDTVERLQVSELQRREEDRRLGTARRTSGLNCTLSQFRRKEKRLTPSLSQSKSNES